MKIDSLIEAMNILVVSNNVMVSKVKRMEKTIKVLQTAMLIMALYLIAWLIGWGLGCW